MYIQELLLLLLLHTYLRLPLLAHPFKLYFLPLFVRFFFELIFFTLLQKRALNNIISNSWSLGTVNYVLYVCNTFLLLKEIHVGLHGLPKIFRSPSPKSKSGKNRKVHEVQVRSPDTN